MTRKCVNLWLEELFKARQLKKLRQFSFVSFFSFLTAFHTATTNSQCNKFKITNINVALNGISRVNYLNIFRCILPFYGNDGIKKCLCSVLFLSLLTLLCIECMRRKRLRVKWIQGWWKGVLPWGKCSFRRFLLIY